MGTRWIAMLKNVVPDHCRNARIGMTPYHSDLENNLYACKIFTIKEVWYGCRHIKKQ